MNASTGNVKTVKNLIASGAPAAQIGGEIIATRRSEFTHIMEPAEAYAAIALAVGIAVEVLDSYRNAFFGLK